MNLTVADVQKISVKDGDTIVVFVDIAGRPNDVAKKMLQEAATFMRANLTNPNVKCIVVPAGMYSFGVIDASAVASGATGTLPVKGTINSGSGAASPSDAYDRAMKGLG